MAIDQNGKEIVFMIHSFKHYKCDRECEDCDMDCEDEESKFHVEEGVFKSQESAMKRILEIIQKEFPSNVTITKSSTTAIVKSDDLTSDFQFSVFDLPVKE